MLGDRLYAILATGRCIAAGAWSMWGNKQLIPPDEEYKKL
jgi:hypothetical protein